MPQTSAASSPPASTRDYWLCQLAGWGINAIFEIWALLFLIGSTNIVIVAGVVENPTPTPAPVPALPWLPVTLQVLALNLAALGLSHALRGFIRRRDWIAKSWLALLPRVIVTGLLLSVPLGYAEGFTYVGLLHQAPAEAPDWAKHLQQSIQWAPLFWAWMTLYFVILENRRRRLVELQQSELTRALQAAELRLLKSQLNPHFLFNSLNSVRALIADDPRRAQDAVTRLARTLRYSLGSGHEDLVTLKQEMEIVDDYLGLEALRLGDRLRIERDIGEDAKGARIPVMLLQTIVENAIKHGIAELPEGGTLRVSGHLNGSALVLEVANPRPAGVAGNAGEGVGLRNSSERLRLLFGGAAHLELDLSDPDRAVTRIRIPTPA